MGENTFYSIIGMNKKLLPNRKMVVATFDENFKFDGVEVTHDLKKYLQETKEDVFIIGGAQIYKFCLPLCDRLYITHVNKEYDGDFYEINERIINLKKPLLTKQAEETIEAMMYAPMEPDPQSFENLYKMIVRDNIQDLIDPNAFSRFFIPFKELSDREMKRYNEEMSQ